MHAGNACFIESRLAIHGDIQIDLFSAAFSHVPLDFVCVNVIELDAAHAPPLAYLGFELEDFVDNVTWKVDRFLQTEIHHTKERARSLRQALANAKISDLVFSRGDIRKKQAIFDALYEMMNNTADGGTTECGRENFDGLLSLLMHGRI